MPRGTGPWRGDDMHWCISAEAVFRWVARSRAGAQAGYVVVTQSLLRSCRSGCPGFMGYFGDQVLSSCFL